MSLRITVVVARAERQELVELALPEGSRVRDALGAPEARSLVAGADPASITAGIWSRRCALDTPLRDGDRVEIYRPLRADAKEMRRSRARLSASTRPRNGT